MARDKKSNVVYSTDPQWQPEQKETTSPNSPASGTAYISLERKGRRGKHVTVVKGLSGNLKPLLKELQKVCGSGGTVKEMQLEIQGDHRKRVSDFLQQKGFKTKQSGG